MPEEVKHDELDTVARTIWGEARGEGPEGMKAVANVIANRALRAREYQKAQNQPHLHYGDGTFSDCCQRPSQSQELKALGQVFSCWNKNDPNRAKLLAVSADDKDFLEAHTLAQQAIAGTLGDNTDGATHYHSMHIAVPAWAVGMFLCAIIGQHAFYRFHDIVISA
jgi:N-acetylmuramoyl-L-alanine amidase